MGAPITDKIRKLHDDDQTVKSGPGHAGFYISKAGNLMVNITEADGPQQIGDLVGAVDEVTKLLTNPITVKPTDTIGIVVDPANFCIWIGAYIEDDVLLAGRETVARLRLIEDTDGAFVIEAFSNQVAGDPVDAGVDDVNITSTLSFDSTNLYYKNDPVLAGTPKVFIIDGSTAGPLVVTGLGANDYLVSVVEFDSGVPADLTAEFTITDADEIDNTGGTDTTGNKLVINVLQRV